MFHFYANHTWRLLCHQRHFSCSEAPLFCSSLLQLIQTICRLLFLYSSKILLWCSSRQFKLRWQSFKKIKQARFHKLLPHDLNMLSVTGGREKHCSLHFQLRIRWQRNLEITSKSSWAYKVIPSLIPLNNVNRTMILKVSFKKQRGLKMAPWGSQDAFRR